MSRLRALVLGLGFFGKNWLREVSACPECEVAGVVAKHPDLLASAGEEFKIPPGRRFAMIEEGLDRSQAQVAIVALPEMIHKAARDGKIGRVMSAGYEFRQAITRTTTDAWREHMPHPYLHDMVVHHFDLLRAITGQDCAEVFARGVRPPWSWYQGLPGVDAILTFEQGMSASYTGTMVTRGFTTPQDGIITLVGEGGTLRLEADQQVRLYRDRQVEVIPPEAMPFIDTAYALREFVGAIREGRRPETHVEDNVRSFAMAAAAITSVETRQPVAVAPLVAKALAENEKLTTDN